MIRLALFRGVVAGSLSALLLLGGSGPAVAQTSADDQALATVLFQKGKALLSEGQVAQACPAFEESQRLDPSGGTILNLALCHELEGRLAHAWSEFNEAVLFARKDGRHDREAAASERARALEPRMSRLTVVVPAGTQVEGLRVEHDGHELARAAWSTAIPVDGGEHVIRASAPGREPFETKVTIAKEAESKTVEIPVLATPVVVVSEQKVTLRPATPAPLSPRLRPIGLVTAGAGVVALGVAGVVLGAALSAKSDSNSHCTGDICDAAGLSKRSEAVSRGDLATIFAVSGVALVAAGVSLFYWERERRLGAHESGSTVGLVLGASPTGGMAGLQGSF
ncbi:MAG TPA: hypothetical protein VH853_10200 [Polyangia bacterium]|jgi:hypothetical protein|nr:hypothetical protein [Polyangia bacterium]